MYSVVECFSTHSVRLGPSWYGSPRLGIDIACNYANYNS